MTEHPRVRIGEIDLHAGTWHLIGIGGVGVSGVARLLAAEGLRVRGSDVRESQITLALRDEGVDVRIGHDAGHLDGVDVVVASTAIPPSNPELAAAQARDLPILHRSQVLGALLRARPSIGVIGTHGKGTVSAAITWLLDAAGLEPGFVIGGLLENYGTNARPGRAGGWLVAEVDESDGSLINSQPTVAVLNNLELDHLNYYKDEAQLHARVRAYFEDNARLETMVVNAADEGVRKLLPHLEAVAARPGGPRLVTFGFDRDDVTVRGSGLAGERMAGSFEVAERRDDGTTVALGPCSISLPGAYNASNVLAAIATARALGVAFETIAEAAPAYRGLENRFTLVQAAGVEVVKDYISHPTGIRRVLEAARGQAEGEVVAVFKPYRFTMIHYLLDDYAVAFADADRVIVTELYTAGEVPIEGTDTASLCQAIRTSCAQVDYVHALDDIAPRLLAEVRPPATVLFFGGDDLFQIADHYASARRSAEHS
jgi:UDP-N-acetylmuramate--alanine ligase